GSNGQESQHDESHDRTQGGCGTCSPENAIYTRHAIINILARESEIKNELFRALNLNRDAFNRNTWPLCAVDSVNRLGLKDTILSKEPDIMSPTKVPQHRGSHLQQSSTFYKLGQERLT
ncbi:hypothetical protein Hamer_G025587, partial [Homarus americanus]